MSHRLTYFHHQAWSSCKIWPSTLIGNFVLDGVQPFRRRQKIQLKRVPIILDYDAWLRRISAHHVPL